MRILHTADWHLGRSLYGRKRYKEFSAFLDWLVQTIEHQKIDVLLVAGDVFDTTLPSNRAQNLYYDFLSRISKSCCRHVIIIAGNHDSPSFLNAPKELLKFLNVHVVGSITDILDNEVILLRKDNNPEAIICAVPYLRDKDIRLIEPGETIDDKNAKLVEGLKNHYAEVCRLAEQKQSELKQAGHDKIPIIAMGHLFTEGGKTLDGDGVRELYVGSLAHVESNVFPSSINYLALGHLHVPQMVGKEEHLRYCGSPIPMGYGEAGQEKKVVFIEFNGTTPDIREISIPCFQSLVRIEGSLDDIRAELEKLKAEKSSAWIEIEYTGSSAISNLREIIEEALDGSFMEIRRIKNQKTAARIIKTFTEEELLETLDVGDVFSRCLDAFDVPNEERAELTASYNEIIKALQEEDANAE